MVCVLSVRVGNAQDVYTGYKNNTLKGALCAELIRLTRFQEST